MNNINDLQSLASNVNVAAAFRLAYKRAKNWKAWIWGPTIILSALQLIAAINIQNFTNFTPLDLAAYVIAMSFFVILASTIGKYYKINKYVDLGSKFQRLHDFNVLKLGVKPTLLEISPSQIKRFSTKWLSKNLADEPNLAQWWPSSVTELQKDKGVALCLLSTFRWESELRDKYSNVLLFILLTLAALSFALMHQLDYLLSDYMVRILVPLSPLFGLLIDEWLSNRSSLKIANSCAEQCLCLWKQADNADVTHELNQLSYIWNGYRTTANPIFDWLYWVTQKSMNEDMIIDANALVADEVGRNC
jgi:hypothetical protein